MKHRLFALALVAICSVAPGARAVPAPPGPVAVITASTYTFLPGDVRYPELDLHVTAGQELLFANLGTEAPHNVREDPSDGTVLFESAAITFGETAVVHGVESLAPGTYTFFCRLHPDLMMGTLHVDP